MNLQQYRDLSTDRKVELTPLGETAVIYQMAYIMGNNCLIIRNPFFSTNTCRVRLQHPSTEETHKENEWKTDQIRRSKSAEKIKLSIGFLQMCAVSENMLHRLHCKHGLCKDNLVPVYLEEIVHNNLMRVSPVNHHNHQGGAVYY